MYMKLKARIQLDTLKLEMALISTILPKSRILLESQYKKKINKMAADNRKLYPQGKTLNLLKQSISKHN